MIVSVEEMVDYMSGIELRPDQYQAVQAILEGVQSEIEGFLNRSIEPTSLTEVVVADALGRAWPAHTPILSVTSCTDGETPPHDVPYDLADGAILLTAGATATVTYVGGIGATHRAHNQLKLEVKRIAAREITGRHDDTLGIKDLNASDTSDPTPPGLQEADKPRLRRWKRRTVA